jgi:hypothetical protein
MKAIKVIIAPKINFGKAKTNIKAKPKYIPVTNYFLSFLQSIHLYEFSLVYL